MLNLIKLLTLVFLLGFSSCFYSTRYVAKYDIKNSQFAGKTKAEILEQINNLSNDYQLQEDVKFNGTDTLGFFGSPYHYFKFWTVNKDSLLTLNLIYYGSFGNRKSPPYETFLSQVSDSLNQNFNVIKTSINEKSNRKTKKKS